MIYLNRILTNPYLEEESVSVSVWPEILYLAKLIGDHFQSLDRGQDPRHGIWNDPICLVCQHISKFTQMQSTKPKTKCAFTPNTNERKWQQLRFQPHLVTKSHIRQELGLPTSSAIVLLWKMMPCMIFHSIQTLCERHVYWMFPFFHTRTDFLFTICVCWLYWAPSFWLCMFAC